MTQAVTPPVVQWCKPRVSTWVVRRGTRADEKASSVVRDLLILISLMTLKNCISCCCLARSLLDVSLLLLIANDGFITCRVHILNIMFHCDQAYHINNCESFGMCRLLLCAEIMTQLSKVRIVWAGLSLVWVAAFVILCNILEQIYYVWKPLGKEYYVITN